MQLLESLSFFYDIAVYYFCAHKLCVLCMEYTIMSLGDFVR